VLGLLRFLIFFVVLAGLLAFVALPALAAPLLTQMVRDAGLRANELSVSVGYFDPSLLIGRSERLRIEARGVSLGPATADGLDLTLGGVDLFGRTFATISGNIRDIELSAGGLAVTVDRVDIDGPAQAAAVTGYFTPAQSIEIVRQSAQRVGVSLQDVRLVDGAIRLRLAGFETRASVAVDGGALVLRPQVGPRLLLLQPAPSDPWRLTEAWITTDGLVVRGVIDAAALARIARDAR
jgi:hypothetical protein